MVFCKNLHKHYGHLHVVKGVDLEIQAGEIVAIVGASGAGKSTLLQLLGTLDQADEGQIQIFNTDVTQLSGKKLAQFRNKHLGFVFQFHQLLPEFTALENAMMPGLIAGLSNKLAEKRAGELLNYLGLGDRHHHKPGQLSGGEQQRVAIARAQFNQPQVIFADEPTGNLDSANAEIIHQYFKQLQRDFNQTMVIVTHNAALTN
ncbi:MAG: ABC transporter ATP-binding protein, partial [Bacteroidota bacterium]